ncbi:MAG: hypothetical protein HQK53_17925 [Oligoflexia bacterium]|nr:hypothetical protein [Oligoflexia bacterium]
MVRYIEIQVKELSSNMISGDFLSRSHLDILPSKTVRIENPFKNCRDFLLRFLPLAIDSSLEDLKKFAFCGNCSLGDAGSPISRFNLMNLKFSGSADGWYKEDISDLLSHPIFEQCKKDGKFYSIENFLIGKTELRVLKELPDCSYDIRNIWLSVYCGDLIHYYFDSGFPLQKILAEAYDFFGWRWFSLGAPEDLSYYSH